MNALSESRATDEEVLALFHARELSDLPSRRGSGDAGH
jgi:hypothetical protein